MKPMPLEIGVTQCSQRIPESKFSEALYQWYLIAISKKLFPDGTQISEKAKEISNQFGFNDFKASKGWFDRWKKHTIKRMTNTGKSGDVSQGRIQD